MSLPLPTNMTLNDWADAAVPYLEQFDSIGRLMGDNWQEWGARLTLALGLSGRLIPDPYSFSDWRVWAQRLCEVLT